MPHTGNGSSGVRKRTGRNSTPGASCGESVSYTHLMHMLISYSDPADSASVVSLINFTGYVGSTVVSIAMSTIANTLALSLSLIHI